jgi:hypothetical protein
MLELLVLAAVESEGDEERLVETAARIIERVQESVPELALSPPYDSVEEALTSHERHNGSVRSIGSALCANAGPVDADRIASARSCACGSLSICGILLNVSETPNESLNAFMANPIGKSRHLAGLLWNTKGRFSLLAPPKNRRDQPEPAP